VGSTFWFKNEPNEAGVNVVEIISLGCAGRKFGGSSSVPLQHMSYTHGFRQPTVWGSVTPRIP
jgi:hypothetical protein